ncbi:MAG TPA: Ig-like domain-containing protein, partial [Saprospiraceae bacterium]|nr:Ig-like domain-containing protein [Saprospiraceae bacterium]
KASQSFVAGTSFLVTATASDNGSISKVEFWRGTTLLSTDASAPYEYTLTSSTAASFSIVARAYDNCGAITNSASRTYTATVSCSDGIKNGNETGVDCGGSCTACQTQCINGTLTLVTDRYPNETSWNIRNSSGVVVVSGGGYTSRFTTYNVNLCLMPGTCYNFVINDSYGDGICCSQGQGSYKIEFNGTTLISGGQFTRTETKQLCVPGTSNNINPEDGTFMLYPNPANNFIVVKDHLVINTTEDQSKEIILDIFDSFGKLVKSIKTQRSAEININVEDLAVGQYFIRLLEKEDILMQNKFLIIR